MIQAALTEEKEVWHRMSFKLRPRGLVIDDDPGELLPAIEVWIGEELGTSWLPEFQYCLSSDSPREIDEKLKGMDFVLLDHRLNDKFKGFRSGLDVGISIRRNHVDLPIFFYTGNKNDLIEPGTKGEFKSEFKRFANEKNVTFYDKADLHPEGKLNDLCSRLVIVSEKLQESASTSDLAELKQLFEANVQNIKRFRYRLVEYDRRKKFQVLRNLEEPNLSEVEIPSSYLSNLKVDLATADILLKVVEFSGGQVLSYFTCAPVSKNELADDVLKYIESL